MEKNLKKDIAYIIAVLFFIALCVIRFWDRTLQDTNPLFTFMGNIHIAEIVTAISYIALVGFIFYLLYRSDAGIKRSMYYLISLFMILFVPMYLCDNYFGTGDVYSWIFVLLAVICALEFDVDFLVIILLLAAQAFSPVHNLGGIFAVYIILLYKAMVAKKKSSTIWFVVGVILYIAGFVALNVTRHISGTSIHRITGKQLIVSVLLLSPIIIFVAKHIFDLIRKGRIEEKLFYIAVILAGAFNFVVMTALGDYCRAVVITMMYFVVVCISLLVMKDNQFLLQFDKAREVILEKIPVPIAIIIYIFAIITYWYFAMDEIDPDILIEFNPGA